MFSGGKNSTCGTKRRIEATKHTEIDSDTDTPRTRTRTRNCDAAGRLSLCLQGALDELNRALLDLTEVSNSSPTSFSINNFYGDKKLVHIPGLVNRIIRDCSGPSRKYSTSPILINVLLKVLLRYLSIMTLNADANADANVSGSNHNHGEEGSGSAPQPISESNYLDEHKRKHKEKKFRRRAIQWANDRIIDLVKPSSDSSIPVLDALLVQSGVWSTRSRNGNAHEMLIRDAFLSATMLPEFSGRDDAVDIIGAGGGNANANVNVNVTDGGVCVGDDCEVDSNDPKQWKEELKLGGTNIKHPFLLQIKAFLDVEKDQKDSLESLIM